MELTPNMYVRTKNGNIGKITFISPLDNLMNLDTENYSIGKHFVEKASHNIIDLIEVGDYANGCKVIKNTLKDGGNIVIVQGGNCFTNDDIKTVVTKEQFEAMEYKVESEVK